MLREGFYRTLLYISAAILIVLFMIHIGLFSYVFVNGGYRASMDWSSVSKRMDSIAWDLFYFIFLTTIMIHTYSGVRGIAFELIKSRGGRRAIAVIIGVIWIIFYFYGLLPIFASTFIGV